MVLDFTQEWLEDNKITKWQYQAFYPSEPSIKPGQDVHIVIQNPEILVVPNQAYLLVTFQLTPATGKKFTSTIYNNGSLHFFSDLRYNLNGVEIDRSRKPGISTLMKALPSWNNNKSTSFFSVPADFSNSPTFLDYTSGKVSKAIPLSYIFGFAEDNKKGIFNARHEIIATINSEEKIKKLVARVGAGETIKLTSVVLYMPVLEVSDEERIKMLQILQSGIYLPLQYRSWELNEIPLPESTSGIWNIKVTSEIEKPRFVIFGMQTNRHTGDLDPSYFDSNTIANAKLLLNGTEYPYEPLNVSGYECDNVYKMYENFRQSYYNQNIERDSPLLLEYTKDDQIFFHYFIICFDCSRQNDSVKSGPVNIVIKYDTKTPIPANTIAYALIISDRHIEYNPLTNLVQKIV